MSMKEAWNAQAAEWTRFARDPQGDRTNLGFNIPAFLHITPPSGRATLDLGCGEGRVGAELQRRGHRVVGIDASPGMAEAASKLIDARVADSASLPFDDSSFDCVVAFMSLQDMDELEPSVAEVGRVLETGGRFCFAIVHPVNSAGGFEGKDPDAPFVITGSYLEPRRFDDAIERDGHRITFFQMHRPVETYFRALGLAGLAVEAIREPRHPEDARWARMPLFLHVRAVKR